MPTLPTLTVTQAQADRLIGVFGSVEAYKAWLLQALKLKVMESEAASARASVQIQIEAARTALESDMSGIV